MKEKVGWGERGEMDRTCGSRYKRLSCEFGLIRHRL